MSTTIRALLSQCGLPRLEGRMLLGAVLQQSSAWLVAHDDEIPAPEAAAQFVALTQRRAAGEPMAYLLGEREFMGHVFHVSPAVLIPRPDTEVLVAQAITELDARPEAAGLLDLGTGSGAIAISVALARPAAQVSASDASAQALAVAQGNAQRLGAQVNFLLGDWFAAVPPQARYDVIVSNPPYVAAGDPHLVQGDLRYEPRMALTDDADGLSDIRQIVAGAVQCLQPGGALWLEHGWDQAPAVRAILADAGFTQINSHADLAGIARISGGYL